MSLRYRDLKELLDKHPDKLDEHVTIYDRTEDESYEVENAYFNNSDSPTADVLDPGHLVLIAKK